MEILSILTYSALLPLLLLLLLTKRFLFSSGEQNLPPSPPSLPLIGHLLHLKKPLHQTLARLSALHGPIILLRLGNRPALVVSSESLADECFTANDLAFADRPRLPSVRVATYNHTTIGTSAYGPAWREMRRIATVEALSGHRLAFFADIRAEETRHLARQLFLETNGGRFAIVELRSRLFGLAMNVVMRMMMGKRCYGEDEGDEEMKRFKEIVEKLFNNGGATNVGDFLPPAIGWLGGQSVRRSLDRSQLKVDAFLQSIVEERRRRRRRGEAAERRSVGRTMLDTMLAMQEDEPEQYNDTFIKALFAGLLFAGTDTSSKAIEWAMSLLLNHPEKLEKATKEIDEKLGHGRLLQESDLANLPYLHCIIKETLRMYPVAPLLLPHESMKACKVGGYAVAPGTMLMINAYVIQRDPSVWPEPSRFVPERFEEKAGGAGAGKFFSFGMGRRRCPGEGLALREMGLVLGTLLQCFEWRRVDEKVVDMEEGAGVTIPKAIPLEALCIPRKLIPAALSQVLCYEDSCSTKEIC